MYLVLLAVVMAVGFSAFAPEKGKNTKQPTYQDDNGFWHNFPGEPCPGNVIPECILLTEDGMRQLFYDNDDTDPVYRYP